MITNITAGFSGLLKYATVIRVLSPVVPTVLGHTTSKNKKVDQTEWWAAKQSLLNNSEVIKQMSPGRRGPKKVATILHHYLCGTPQTWSCFQTLLFLKSLPQSDSGLNQKYFREN